MPEEIKKRRISGRRWQEEIEIELEDGSVKTLMVKALMGDGRDEFLNYQANKMKFNKEGVPIGTKDTKGTTLKLLSLALFEPGNAEPMTEAEIRALRLPSAAELELVGLISEKSGLTKPEDKDPNS